MLGRNQNTLEPIMGNFHLAAEAVVEQGAERRVGLRCLKVQVGHSGKSPKTKNK